MKKLQITWSCLLLVMLSVSTALAQDTVPKETTRASLTVTASASADCVRFTAPSSVVQMRLEVYGPNAEKLFDTGLKGGNVLDWPLQNSQAERLPSAAYLCVVTVKTLSGKMTQRLGSVTVEDNAASVKAAEASQLTTQQAQSVGPLEDDATLTIVQEGEPQSATVTAHNGEEGQFVRGKGALSFRLGDFYSGKDREQMRLTPEGNVGIGITHPQARLDVDGLIRTSQGIVFPDGSVQTSAANSTTMNNVSIRGDVGSSKKAGRKSISPAIAGTGTQNLVSKWTDNDGTLGDSAISEVGGNVGIGTASPQTNLHVAGGISWFQGDAVSLPAAAGKGIGVGYSGTVDEGYIFAFDYGSFTPRNLLLNHPGGNVGIGTLTPTLGRLQVAGGSLDAIVGISTGNGRGLWGESNGWQGVFGKSNTNAGVVGEANLFHAVFGISHSANNGGVFGANDASGFGVIGTSDGGIGVAGDSASPGGFGGRFRNTGGGLGVIGTSDGGIGVAGDSANPNGFGGRFRNTGGGKALRVEGTGSIDVVEITGGGDFSENFDVTGAASGAANTVAGAAPAEIRPGLLVSIDPRNPGKLAVSSRAYDRRVAGIISGAGDIKPGIVMGQEGSIASGKHPVALTGRVYCWADASNGPIRPGDLLTSSATAGHAMKATDRARAKGAIIGKAMTGLKSGKGLVLVLVTLQ